MIRVHNSLRELRKDRAWSQARMAALGGISRQAYAAIEDGSSVPSTEVALRLAAGLGTTVDELFRLPDFLGRTVEAEVVGPLRDLPFRVTLARVRGRLLARAEAPGTGKGIVRAHGIVRSLLDRTALVELLVPHPPRSAIVVLGGDPALGMLASELTRERGLEVQWWPMGSSAALHALARGEAHVAGIHLIDPLTGQYNVAAAAALPFPVNRIGFALREQGLIVRAGNPLALRGVADLTRHGIRFINREEGSGTRYLLERHLETTGIRGAEVNGYRTAAPGHFAVAESIAAGVCDAGVGIRAASLAFGLGYIPLEVERYDLVVPDHFLDLPAVQILLEHLRMRPYRTQVEALGGYDLSPMGVPG